MPSKLFCRLEAGSQPSQSEDDAARYVRALLRHGGR
jgi:hypothetical protein